MVESCAKVCTGSRVKLKSPRCLAWPWVDWATDPSHDETQRPRTHVVSPLPTSPSVIWQIQSRNDTPYGKKQLSTCDLRVGSEVYGWRDRWMEGCRNGWTVGWMDGWKDGMDGWMEWCDVMDGMDGMHVWKDVWKDGMDGWDGWMGWSVCSFWYPRARAQFNFMSLGVPYDPI